MIFERVWVEQNQRTAVLFTFCFVLCSLHSKAQTLHKEHTLDDQNGTLLSEEKLAHLMATNIIWKIEVQIGYRIELTVRIFEIKTSCCSCIQDYVEIRDGLNSTAPLIGRYCANNKPLKVYSSQNVLRVKYFSSPKKRYQNISSINKFRADYQTICGKYILGASGEISSPSYPNFTSGVRCFYTIVVPYGWVQVNFTDFRVGVSDKLSNMCGADFILALETTSVELKYTAKGLEQLCGQLKSPFIFSRGQELSLLYQSSGSNHFRATFEATTQSLASCGGFVRGNAGYIYSYGYPNPYPSNAECRWNIEVPHGSIKLTFLMFNFTCTDGRVEIFDGWSGDSVKIRGNCGRVRQNTWVKSQSNRLQINAKSGQKSTGSFVLSYTVAKQGLCSAEKFSCTSRECVSRKEVCDGVHNCSDGSDELNCPKKEHSKSLYILWVLIVLFASVLMVIWLWRTWRKAVHHTLHVRRARHCPEADDYEYEAPSQTGAPPTYSEALGHNPSTLPSYEEAFLDDSGQVVIERDNRVRFLAHSNSCNHQGDLMYESQRPCARPHCTGQSLAIL